MTNEAKRLSDAELVKSLRHIGDYTVETAEWIADQSADAIKRLSASTPEHATRQGMTEDVVRKIISAAITKARSRLYGRFGESTSLHDPIEIIDETVAAILSATSHPSSGGSGEAAAIAMREKAAKMVEQRAAELNSRECCGHGVRNGYDSPPECCGDPLYMISSEDAAKAIRALPLPIQQSAMKENDDG